MPCHIVRLPGGVTAIVKTAAPRPRKCAFCERRSLNHKLCDFDIGGGKTCDLPICSEHATHHPPDTDYCPRHAAFLEGRML